MTAQIGTDLMQLKLSIYQEKEKLLPSVGASEVNKVGPIGSEQVDGRDIVDAWSYRR